MEKIESEFEIIELLQYRTAVVYVFLVKKSLFVRNIKNPPEHLSIARSVARAVRPSRPSQRNSEFTHPAKNFNYFTFHQLAFSLMINKNVDQLNVNLWWVKTKP